MSIPLKERKPNRWKGFDYASENAYFLTICVDKKLSLFGKVIDKKMQLNEYGKIVEQCWNDLPNHYPNCILDTFTVMPNHIHGVIVIDNSVFESANTTVGNGLNPFPTNIATENDVGNRFNPFIIKKHGLSEMVRALKTFSSRRINEKLAVINMPTNADVGNDLKPFPTNAPPNNVMGNRLKPFPSNIPSNDSIGNGLKPFPTKISLRFKWQKSFHDHIIRDFKSLEQIRNYIKANPANWEKDMFHEY